MDHVLSTQLFVNQRLSTALLDRILASGIPAVELFVNRQHLDYLNTAQIHEIASWFRDSKLELWALHSPMYSDDQNGLSGPKAVIAINEPIKSYAPGSAERAELKARLAAMEKERPEIPLVIGGQEIRTGDIAKAATSRPARC